MALLRLHKSALLLVVATGLTAVGCGSASTHGDSTRNGQESASSRQPALSVREGDDFEDIRAEVIHGAAKDFAEGTGIGGPRYEECLLGQLRRVLDRSTLIRLIQVYRRPGGQQFAAQALNDLALPLGARCGHRFYVPELVEASRGLAKGKLAGGAVRKLGVTYGPYLGVRCRRANRIGCDRVGVDVVFNHAASRVIAVMDGRRLRLRTPGMHSGVSRYDWVGTLSQAGIGRPGSLFRPRDNHRARGFWAGYPPIYVSIELRVRYANGRRAAARFPHVFLSPGWG